MLLSSKTVEQDGRQKLQGPQGGTLLGRDDRFGLATLIASLGAIILGIAGRGVTFAAGNIAAGNDGEVLLETGFETGTEGWAPLWTRAPQSGDLTLDRDRYHSGRQAVRIEHRGQRDWSFGLAQELRVSPGEIYELSAWLWVEGEGDAALAVVLRDRVKKVLDWFYGGVSAEQTTGWREVKTQFLIPEGTDTLLPRVTGNGPTKVWVDDVRLVRAGNLAALRERDLPAETLLNNENIAVTFRPKDGRFSFRSPKNSRVWETKALEDFIVLSARGDKTVLEGDLLYVRTLQRMSYRISLAEDAPEVLLELQGAGELKNRFSFPGELTSRKGEILILPVNEGISYPVDDESLSPMEYHLFGGHGLCMAWWGITDGRQGLMAIVETPDDAVVSIPKRDGLLCLAPRWLPQKGMFGPARRLRFVVLDDGGYVAMCKRYRKHAQATGLFKTLAEKRKANPHVDLLIGAVNIWCWDKDPVSLCRELQQAGIRRILWSNRATPGQIRQLNEMGILTSRYDIYQDVMNPENFPKLRGVHSDWPTEAWPHDLIVDAGGSLIRGWEVQGRDGTWYACNVLCDRRAVDYARKRIVPELQTHPYRCRFIDTTTASPWRECYHLDHPMTRSESRYWKMQLLRFVGEECGLVVGSETGHDAAVPFVHYFEGMLSLGPYRIPDAGRNMQRIWEEVPERVAKFQTGHYYRLPLWELVYHDCVVAQWYWGDYNNKLPAVWDRRDLWNALYGTPPMFMFDRALWAKNRDRFLRSYQVATPVARATGYVEMLSHEWLTTDHCVQQTRFANGVVVTVNFGDTPYRMPDGRTISPLGHLVDGLVEN